MTELEYKHKMQVIETEYLQSKKKLYIDYAAAQRKYKIGDVIKNGNGVIIQIQKFGTSILFSLPQPTYIGRELKKDLHPKKNGDIKTIYGNKGVELLVSATM